MGYSRSSLWFTRIKSDDVMPKMVNAQEMLLSSMLLSYMLPKAYEMETL